MVISDIHHSAVSRKLIDESRHFVILCTRAIFNITALKKASFFNLHESTTKKDYLNTVSMRRCFGSGLPFWEILVVIGGSPKLSKNRKSHILVRIHHLKVFILSTFRRLCPSPKRNPKPTLHP